MLILFFQPNYIGAIERQRLTEQDTKNLLRWQEDVNKIAEQYDIPHWIIAGVLYNESNFRPAIRGGNIGHGQINCRTWLPSLKREGIASNCSDLLKPDISIKSVGYILHYLSRLKKSKKPGGVDWPIVLSYYRHGYRWKKPDLGYYSRVYFFGKNIRSHWTTRKVPWCNV